MFIAACGEGMSPRNCGAACQNSCKDPHGIRCAQKISCFLVNCYCDEGLVYAGNGTCHSRDLCPKCTVPHNGGSKILEVKRCKDCSVVEMAKSRIFDSQHKYDLHSFKFWCVTIMSRRENIKRKLFHIWLYSSSFWQLLTFITCYTFIYSASQLSWTFFMNSCEQWLVLLLASLLCRVYIN